MLKPPAALVRDQKDIEGECPADIDDCHAAIAWNTVVDRLAGTAAAPNDALVDGLVQSLVPLQ